MKHALLIGIDHYPHLGERYFLEGCKRDVELLRGLLTEHFDFPPPKILLDEEATRSGILQAMQALLHTVEQGDLVVFYFSGHGSQRARLGKEGVPPTYDETIVPSDSGRPTTVGSPPNRDLFDKDIRDWLRLLASRAAHVTLIFDCCHSGGMLRDDIPARVRQVPKDGRLAPRRAVAWRSPDGVRPPPLEESQYTLFAACRPRELAFELPVERHGALTFFLARSLVRAGDETTNRDLFETLCPQVTGCFPSQHPLREGQLSRKPFGAQVRSAMSFFRVTEPRSGAVEIEIGAVHGVQAGTRFLVYPPGTKNKAEREPLGLVELERVESVTSRGRWLKGEPARPASLEGCQAVLESYRGDDLQTSVALTSPLTDHSESPALRRRLELSPWLRLVEGGIPRIRLHLLESDLQVLAATGQDGKLALPLLPADTEGAFATLLSHLEALARYRNILAIENLHGGGGLAEQMELRLWRLTANAMTDNASANNASAAINWTAVESSGTEHLACRAGNRFGIRLLNRSTRKVFPYVLDLGLTGKVSLLYPVAGAYEPLLPGQCLELGMDPDEMPIELRLPTGLPFDALLGRPRKEHRRRTEYIKVFITSRVTEFGMLHQEGYRTPPPQGPQQPLEQLLWRAWTGTDRLIRCRPTDTGEADAWATLTRCFEVEY